MGTNLLLLDTPQMAPEDILSGLARGDAAAAEALLDRFEGPLTRYFQLSLPDASAAEDAAQEVFLRFLCAQRDGKLSAVRSLEAYVFTIARRLAIDLQRSWARRPRLESLDAETGGTDSSEGVPLHELTPGSDLDPREAASRGEREEHLHAALLRLDEKTREIVVLRHIEGLSSQQVADILGISVGAVWTRLHRGLNELRGLLAGRQSPSPSSRRTAP